MNMWLSVLIIAVSTLIAVGIMLALRRVAPAGSYVRDSDRSSGVFGFVGTAFAVLLAFVIFLATETYTNAKTEAGHEADALLNQYEVAGVLPSADRDLIRGQLICYGRAVINDEWRLMRHSKQSTRVDNWALLIDHAAAAAQVTDMRADDGLARFFEETTVREQGRSGRLQESDGSVPSPMWLMLILGSVCLVGYMLFYADSSERAIVQAAQIGVVVAMVVTSLLLIDFLDHPFRNTTASIQPGDMRSSVQAMERDGGSGLSLPCDAGGRGP